METLFETGPVLMESRSCQLQNKLQCNHCSILVCPLKAPVFDCVSDNIMEREIKCFSLPFTVCCMWPSLAQEEVLFSFEISQEIQHCSNQLNAQYAVLEYSLLKYFQCMAEYLADFDNVEFLTRF